MQLYLRVSYTIMSSRKINREVFLIVLMQNSRDGNPVLSILSNRALFPMAHYSLL